MPSFPFRFSLILALVATFFLIACGGSSSDNDTTQPPTVDPTIALKSNLVNNYASLVHTNYSDALQTAKAMRGSIQAFLANPSDETLNVAKQSWLTARIPYGQTEGFRFYEGPIDNVDGPEGLLNAWPLDENYIDYVVGSPASGIIADTANYPELSATLLRELNEKDGEANIATGYHAIEFLLWGQDLSAEGPGNRPFTDFVVGQEDFAERRAAYLSLTTDMLVEDLEFLVAAWAPDSTDNYRASFVDDAQALRNILVGIGSLCGAELAGERMSVAMDTREQEDEHSCFSDNTHVDILMNAKSLQNVYLGRYETSDGVVHDGPGFDDLMAVVDADLNQRVVTQLQVVVDGCAAIPAPFDTAVQDPEKRPSVQGAIDDLRALTTLFVSTAEALDITLNLEE